ncbi:SMI1/KNR4 family protein [Kurthia populi]|uniref:SMI1/KNR4 family protein n=1 Tax=Kurthia populi TaxID=1562132 RepID=A0ABW5XYC3_9BACL
MQKYELTKKQIFEYANTLELAFFDGVTPELIAAFEKTIGFEIKGSYKQFLLDFGFLSFGSLEIFGIPHKEILKQNEDDTNALTQTLASRKEINLSENLLIIYNFGNGELYCLDLSEAVPKVVVIWDAEAENNAHPPITEVIADSFEDFFEEYVNAEMTDFEEEE